MAENPNQKRRAEMVTAMEALESVRNDRSERGKNVSARNRARFANAAMDITGGPNDTPNGRVTSDDLNKMDANKDGKLTKDEIMAGIGGNRMPDNIRRTAERMVTTLMDGKDERSIEEIAGALRDANVQVDGQGGQPPRQGGGGQNRGGGRGGRR